MVKNQDLWDSHLSQVKELCSTSFWRVFLRMHTCAIGAIDSALTAVRETFDVDKKLFPSSRRALLQRIATIQRFWPRVLHTYTLDLTPFAGKLPSNTKSLDFKFIDPLWAWLIAARRQEPIDMHWKPIAQRRGFEQYGGGIQYGKFLAKVSADIPEGTYPMCIGIHWDGTSAHGQSSSPICICVGNTNSCDSSTQYCIGYMPHVPDEKKPEWKKRSVATTVKHYIRQKCEGAILRILLEGAKRGVQVRLCNRMGRDVERVMFPRLSSMNFDQPEAQLMFGLQNKQACSKCRQDNINIVC